MPKLGINIDHVATLREARKGIEPEPVFTALLCETAGADSIVVHLREDRRHIKDRDVYLLREVIKTRLNLEMSTSPDIVDIACKIKPDQATFVPEKRQELTTEGGLDVRDNLKKVKAARQRLEKKGIAVSLFIDPDKNQILAAKETGAKIIELHTGCYADARTEKEQNNEFLKLKNSVEYAKTIGLIVNAGHGLNYYNVSQVAKIRGIEELNIGYSIICRAVIVGLERAVKEMKALI